MVETTALHREWSTPLTSQTNTRLAVFATGLSRCPDPLPSSSTSPSLTSLTRQTWWSYWTDTLTRWLRALTAATHHGSWWTSQATSSYSTSTQTAQTRPKDLLCFTKVLLDFTGFSGISYDNGTTRSGFVKIWKGYDSITSYVWFEFHQTAWPTVPAQTYQESHLHYRVHAILLASWWSFA